MAGKHVGAWRNSDDPLPGFEWNERTTKAYAEGRYNIAPNGHVAGSDAYRAYVAGAALSADDTQAFESGAGAGAAPSIQRLGYYYEDTLPVATEPPGGDPVVWLNTLADNWFTGAAVGGVQGRWFSMTAGQTVTRLGICAGGPNTGGDTTVGLALYDFNSPLGNNTPQALLASGTVTFQDAATESNRTTQYATVNYNVVRTGDYILACSHGGSIRWLDGTTVQPNCYQDAGPLAPNAPPSPWTDTQTFGRDVVMWAEVV